MAIVRLNAIKTSATIFIMFNQVLHKKLTDREGIKDAIRKINDAINGCGLSFMEDTDGRYQSYAYSNISEKNILIVLASFDFSYYHDLELVFYEVEHTSVGNGYSWWDHGEKDQIELAAEEKPGVFEFRFNVGTHSDKQYIVRAKGFSYYSDKVVYRLR